MTKFNPFAKANCKYGAPMGRGSDDPATYNGASKLYARHCGGDGYYDRGGAYWGHSKVCAVWTRGGTWCAYVEAWTPAQAIEFVRDAQRKARNDRLGFMGIPLARYNQSAGQ